MQWNLGLLLCKIEIQNINCNLLLYYYYYYYFGNREYITNRNCIAQGPVSVRSLLHLRPVRSYNKSNDVSTGGVSKRTKGCWRRSAILASWSTCICFSKTVFQLSPKAITEYSWCDGHSTSISACEVWRVITGVQVSRRKLYTHIHLD